MSKDKDKKDPKDRIQTPAPPQEMNPSEVPENEKKKPDKGKKK